MRGLRRLARKSDTSSEAGLWVIWRTRGCCLLWDGVYGDSYGSLLRRSRRAKERERVGRGAVWHFFTATAQTRTRETAEADNEIIPRGGASVRVLEAKPSPFFDIFVGFGEKIGGHGGLLGRFLGVNGLRFVSRKPAKNGLEIWLRKEYFSILLFKECLK